MRRPDKKTPWRPAFPESALVFAPTSETAVPTLAIIDVHEILSSPDLHAVRDRLPRSDVPRPPLLWKGIGANALVFHAGNRQAPPAPSRIARSMRHSLHSR